MTGFGSAEGAVGTHRVAVEIRSVNHRFFSPSIKVPSSLARLEGDIREALRERITRGHVTASVRIGSDSEAGPRIDGERIAIYARQLEEIGRLVGLSGPVTMDTLLRLPQVMTTEEAAAPPDQPEAILPVVRQALEQMDGMRAVEGAKLKAIITDRLAAIEAAMHRVAERAPARVVEQRDRLRKAVTSLMEGALPDESRIAQEIAILADRLDVAEEIARFATHISAFRATLDAPPVDGVGKRLGFLLQELLREANTTGSKANDAAITAEVLAIKEDLERIREQVENLE
ncbi:MAG TPA: YicC/YloC family endoribonuclease [Gemmatimonadaceae bacterium]|nr:YicC/YloC family endoribonuclease [Gemmatimonadaceae bacterium]